MSTYELYKKINCEKFTINVSFPSFDDFSENFEIDETSTIEDLFNVIKKKSIVLKENKKKNFYWIFYVKKDNKFDFQYVNNEEFIVKLIGVQEEIEFINENNLNSNENNSVNKNINFNNNFIIDMQTLINFELNDFDDNNNNNLIYNENKTFNTMILEVRRRIFSPSILLGEINNYNFFEQDLLFYQIKNVFYNSSLVDYTWYNLGEELSILCYLESIAKNKRLELIENFIEIEQLNKKNVITIGDIKMDEIENFEFFINKNNNNNLYFNENYQQEYSSVRTSYNNNNEINNNEINNEEKNLPENKYLNINIEYPKNLDKKDKTLKSTFDNIKKNIIKLNDPKKYFFKLLINRPILFNNIFEVRIKQSNENFPEKFLISIGLEKIEFLHQTNSKKFFEFKYDEIVKCLISNDYQLILVINLIKDENEKYNEIIIRLESINNRFILEDILSYCQIFLAKNTKSIFIEKNNFNNIIQFKNNYKLIFERSFPFFNLEQFFNKEINEKEIQIMREKLHNNFEYKEYKKKLIEDKNKLEKEAKEKEKKDKEAHKAGTFDINNMKNIMRFNQNFDDDEDDENKNDDDDNDDNDNNENNSNSDSSGPKIQKFNFKKENDNNNNNEINNINDKNSIKLKNELNEKENDDNNDNNNNNDNDNNNNNEIEDKNNEELIKKQEENINKRKAVENIMANLMESFDFSDESNNNSKEEEKKE